MKGYVEVDETYLAITDREEPISPVGRKNKTTKVLVVLAVELLQPKGFGRIRLQRIDNDSDACVVPFVQACIEPGAQVRTDGSAAYRSLSGLGYDHQRTVMLGSDVPAHVSMAGVHRVASLIKRAGSWERITGRSNRGTWTPTWTSTCSASTAALRVRAGCCSTGSCSRPSSPIQ